MTTLNKTWLPRELKHRGKRYKLLGSRDEVIAPFVLGHIEVHVLSPNLKGRLDLHGNPYKPTEWIFIPA